MKREKTEKRRPQNRIAALEKLRIRALRLANRLVSRKGADYGHWSTYPLIALASLNFVKAKRMLELATKDAAGRGEAVNEPLEDSCLDTINYASFIYGLLKEKGKERKNV